MNVKQGGKYHFLTLWYNLIGDWTQVSWSISEHSNYYVNKKFHLNLKKKYCFFSFLKQNCTSQNLWFVKLSWFLFLFFIYFSDEGLSKWQCWPEQQHHQHYPPEPQLNGDHKWWQRLHETVLSSVIKPELDKLTAFLPLERPPGAATARADAAVAVATDNLGRQDWDLAGGFWWWLLYLYSILISQSSQTVLAFHTVATAMAVYAHSCGCR